MEENRQIFTLNTILPIVLILTVVIVGVLIIQFLISSGKKAKKDDPHALGLPQGSVRAILSISLIVFFILIALFFYFDSPDGDKPELAESILTILGTLVIAVSSFYFGVKATEQGNKIAQETFAKATDYQNNQSKKDVPIHIIQEAIKNNKDSWIEQYKCEDIKLGKKKVGQTQFELVCILFVVKEKVSPSSVENEIPSFINYNSKGKDYEIPTDVVSISELENKKTSKEKRVSLNLIEEALAENKDRWIVDYNAKDILAALKVKGGQRQKVPCIQFIVSAKSSQLDTKTIPGYLTYQNTNIPTDVVEKDQADIDSSNLQIGDAAWRQGTTTKGTLGIKVYRENADGSRTDFLLSCYHVFCSSELSNGIKEYTSTSNDSIVAEINGNTIEIAKVAEGEINTKLDAALSKINSHVSVDSQLKGFLGMPRYGIRLITNQEVIDETTVFTYGARTKKAISGTVISRVSNPVIKVNGKKIRFENVIPVTKISVKGDSGAMVVDDKGKIIGIIFASDGKTSYIIPILEIISHFNIKVYYA